MEQPNGKCRFQTCLCTTLSVHVRNSSHAFFARNRPHATALQLKLSSTKPAVGQLVASAALVNKGSHHPCAASSYFTLRPTAPIPSESEPVQWTDTRTRRPVHLHCSPPEPLLQKPRQEPVGYRYSIDLTAIKTSAMPTRWRRTKKFCAFCPVARPRTWMRHFEFQATP